MTDRLPISRRTVLTAGAIGALGAALPLSSASAATVPASGGAEASRRLAFRSDGTFKVVFRPSPVAPREDLTWAAPASAPVATR